MNFWLKRDELANVSLKSRTPIVKPISAQITVQSNDLFQIVFAKLGLQKRQLNDLRIFLPISLEKQPHKKINDL